MRWRRRIDADPGHPGWAKPPAAGAGQPRPLPGSNPPSFTGRDLHRLSQVDHWADQLATRDPARLVNASKVADGFRTEFPHLSDDDLGRLLLACSVLARDYGLAGTSGRLPGTLALAAGALTRLSRTEVTVNDQH